MSDDNPPVDHVLADDAEKTTSAIEQNLKSKSTWMRLVFMVLFCILASIATMVASVVVILGFLWMLLKGEANPRLRRTGQSLGMYLYEIVLYLTYNSEERPFPVDGEWPSESEESSD